MNILSATPVSYLINVTFFKQMTAKQLQIKIYFEHLSSLLYRLHFQLKYKRKLWFRILSENFHKYQPRGSLVMANFPESYKHTLTIAKIHQQGQFQFESTLLYAFFFKQFQEQRFLSIVFQFKISSNGYEVRYCNCNMLN